jgi:FtsP/CotA-like multicopper oxidase with cupredoxin domain
VERKQRIWLIVVAVVIAAAGIFAIQSGGDDDDESSTTADTVQTQPQEGEPTGTVKAPTPKPEPEFQKVVIANGKVRGGEQEIEYSKGDTARIEVTSDAPDEIHVHGYDLTKPVAPGKPARFSFKANAEGIFEIEAHDLGHVIVATLVVEP